MPRGKRDPGLLSPEGKGSLAAGDGRRSAEEEEEEEEEDGHLPGLPRDDLTKSMSSSSVSSYHSALCSDGTETFKDCLEFLDEEGSAGRAVPGRWAPAGAPGAAPPPGPLARPQRAQLSGAAKNSPAQGQGSRMGPLGGERQPVPAVGEPAVPRQPAAMLAGLPSDSDEVDGEVQALTARAFRSLSGLPGARLDMCSSHTSSSLSNSLSEDGGRPRRWPAGAGEPRGAATAPHGRVGWPFPAAGDGELLGKEQFECVDVELESGEARKGYGKKRTVPKRQILLKRKERKEPGFGPRGDGPAPQPPARKEPPGKGRAAGEDFRLNYQQFMKAASLGTDRTRAASCLVKNVLAKKMQYEQRIKMEQKGMRGSSTSSGPSSAGTDLLGDGLEGKSSSLSRSDCSFSAEDLRAGAMPVATAAAANATSTASHPTKGVVLSEATRETVCNLRKTFNELNQRMKYQEVLEGRWLPAAAEKHTSERICYQRARALFEAQPGVGKVLDVAPRFARAPRPWPSLKERAIGPIHSQSLPFKAESRALPAAPPRRPFGPSRAQEARPLPQARPEKPPAAPRRPPSPGTPAPRGSPPAAPPKPEEKGKGRVPQPRDVRKLVKSSYSLKFGTGGASRGTAAPASSGEPPPAAPLVIHCTSVRREPEPAAEEGLAAPGPEPACAEGPAKPPGSRAAPPHSSPINITRVQATRRGALPSEEPASPPRRERSELRVPPRPERLPHVETHLHVLVGRPGGGSGPAAGSALLRAEKTVLLPPPPGSPAEGREPPGQRRGSGDSRDPRAEQPQPRGRRGSGGSSGGSPGRPPEHREPWERSPHWPAAAEPYPPAGPAENSSYLAMPERAPKPTLMPKLASVPNPASASFGTPFVPSPASASFGAPSAPNPASASFGTSMVTNVTSSSFGFPLASSLASTSFGTPLVSSSNKSFGAPLVPNLCSTSFGSPLVPNPTTVSFGSPLVPNPSSTSFGSSLVPNPTTVSFGSPLVPNPSSTSFGSSLVPNPTTVSFGSPLVPNPSSTSFGPPLIPNASSASFGNPLVPNPSGTSFGSPLGPNPSNVSFGSPLVPNPSSASFGSPLIPNPSSASFGSPLVPNPSSASFGSPLVPNPSSASFGSPLVPNPSSASFGSPLVPNPSSTSFGSPPVPNPSSASFGSPAVPNPSSASFGSPLVPNPSSASFGSPLVPNPSSASFGNPLIPNPGSPFGSPLVSNPVPTSLGHPSVSNMPGSFFGSPFVPNPASALLGTGAYPLPGGEVPWSKPSPELPLPRPPEGPAAVEPPAQPHLEDAPHFLRRTDGPSPSGRSRQSPPKPFSAPLPAQRRMLVDPSSGKCYYVEPPRQPQMKTLYDPETGQYLEVLVPPVASHTGLYQAPFNPLLMAPGVCGPPYAPYGGFPGLPAPPPPAPSPPRPSPAADTPGSAPKGEGPSPAGGPDCGYLESLYYIPTGMRASPGPEQPPGRASPAAPEGSLLRM
ncbi:proline-rich basic protein 1 [Oenanthe melanoleuca]|uniref:proline-rich basic protein 1 n=1 Tax=Oenanthe melanoleuca TaxID=2939378 RepID=UPI0024C17FBC|nr:proline-rich basic protein 1 [Oenanthe melanoleuca]